ncbi:PEBP-like protein [Guyanagaster necrorhizus]|uniref:PEBP-like protein n=1 Tax=Guyanagaster necrorhizus TaxID=856835 RepID=A0A9P7VPB3_9AGAR|nr:PEBP-like protein [Guyanagaster necrorhizus MCA 3950]KAG7444132.1 PEBP-like protein [Guyanagaster necrorhizus MCA 3950]
MLRIFTFAILAGLLSQVVLSQDTSLRKVKEAFHKANIPEDIGQPFNPKYILEVTFAQPSGPAHTLKAGIQLPRNVTGVQPLFALIGQAVTPGPYVIVAVDPDSPTPQNPKNAQIRHFLGGNFRPTLHLSDRAVLRPLIPVPRWILPTPPAGSDPHRYIFLLYNQPQDFSRHSLSLVNASSPIIKFNISEFGKAVGLGNPIAGTFMLVAPGPA